jgi:tripartite-type tricarboxylate transporter receptor subunit TctC
VSGQRIILSALLAIGASLAAGASLRAQTFPDRLIRIVVPFPPGGPVDVTGRILAQHLGPIIGQTVIIENRAGAAGAIGAKAVANAEPDGHTLLLGNISTLVVLPVVTNNRDYDPSKVFAPIAKVSQNFEVLVVHPDFPARTVQELVAYAKAHPGKLNYGSAGPGNATHLAAELFRLRTGIDIVHVPYKGAFEAATGVIGGQVHLFFGDIAGLIPLIREGRLRALAVTGERRSAELPELPTMIESGVPDFVVLTFIGAVAPARTAPDVIGKLNVAINATLRSEAVAAALAKLGAEVHAGSPHELAAFLAKEREKWTEVVQRAEIKVD